MNIVSSAGGGGWGVGVEGAVGVKGGPWGWGGGATLILGDAIRLICIGKVNCRSGAGV